MAGCDQNRLDDTGGEGKDDQRWFEWSFFEYAVRSSQNMCNDELIHGSTHP